MHRTRQGTSDDQQSCDAPVDADALFAGRRIAFAWLADRADAAAAIAAHDMAEEA